MGISTVLAFMTMPGMPAFVAVAHKIATGIDSFSLLAIPFFILSGVLMGHGGIARRLIDFANVLVGRFRGGLAFVNVLTCMLFGAISGSATAAVSGVGGFMVPVMNRMGYDRDFNTSVTITAATTGLLIPPSNIMIVYSLATGGIVSIAAIFMAGFLPGFLMGLALMTVAGILAFRHKYGSDEIYKFHEIMIRIVGAVLCLFIPGFLLYKRSGLFPAEDTLKKLGNYSQISASAHKLNITFIWTLLVLLAAMAIGYAFMVWKKNRHGAKITAGFIGLLFVPVWFLKGFLYGRLYGINSYGNLSLALSVYSLLVIGLVAYYIIKVSPEGFICFIDAVPSLLLVYIVLGGILSGIFTATEASAVAVLYAFILAVVIYQEVKIKDLPKILLQTGVTTSVVFLLIGTSMAMSWVLASENVPQDISTALLNTTGNKVLLLLMINALLLVVGTFMDMTPAVLIFTPIFLPIVEKLGIHPLQFGIIIIMNLCIGLCTPPVGTCLFLGCGITNTTVTNVMRHILPFFAAMIVALIITTFVPALSMWLPDVLGFVK
jgi:TRAP-type C4-dicarboxylate transport system permease large subunit